MQVQHLPNQEDQGLCEFLKNIENKNSSQA